MFVIFFLMLAPGGTLALDVDPLKTSCTQVCLFSAEDSLDTLKSYAQVFKFASITLDIAHYNNWCGITFKDNFVWIYVYVKLHNIFSNNVMF